MASCSGPGHLEAPKTVACASRLGLFPYIVMAIDLSRDCTSDSTADHIPRCGLIECSKQVYLPVNTNMIQLQ